MAPPSKLTPALAKEMCGYASQGLPIGRSAALVGVHRVTAMRWKREGGSEIAEAADDYDAEMGLRGQFAIDFDAARAGYLLKLTVQWQAAVDEGDHHVAKVIAAMLASQAPDEYSERRATRHVDQRTTLTGDVTVNRFASMSAEDLDAERQRIEARRAASQNQDDADWRAAAVRLPRPAGDEDAPGPVPEENDHPAEKRGSGSIKRKSEIGGLPGDDQALSDNITPTRARANGAGDELDPDVVLP